MSSSPVYVAWMCSTRVSPAAMEFTASFMTATALDTAWRSLLVIWRCTTRFRAFSAAVLAGQPCRPVDWAVCAKVTD